MQCADQTNIGRTARTEVNKLCSTAARLIEQAPHLVEVCCIRTSHISRSFKANEVNTHRVAHVDSGCEWCAWSVRCSSALDRIGREQLLPNKPVICLSTSESLQRKSIERN